MHPDHLTVKADGLVAFLIQKMRTRVPGPSGEPTSPDTNLRMQLFNGELSTENRPRARTF